MFAAMSTADFDSPSAAAACGKCVQITGPTGMTATIPVYDQCPTSSNPKCVNGHIDLSHAAFAAVVPGNYQYGGEVPNDHAVAWKYVACPVNGPIVYHFKDGVNAGWIAVQVRNARAGIRTIRYRKNGQWIDMTPRTDQLAYFIVQGLNATTIDLQAVDEFGHVLEDDGVAVNANSDVNGHAQFPACP